VPGAVAGKKILCKACQAHISVPAARSAAKPGAANTSAGTAKQSAAKSPAADATGEDEWKNFKPYNLLKESDLPRCPFCAAEVEEDQVVCLACGFNRRTRSRHDYKMFHPLTANDWILWLTPGIGAALFALFCIGVIVSVFTHVPYIAGLDSIYFTIGNKAIPIYVTLGCLVFIYLSGNFAIRRLVLNPTPPLREKHAHEEEEKDEE
jgi:hypothetical protein